MGNYQTTLSDIFDRRAEQRIDSAEEERKTLDDAKAGEEAATIRLLLAYAPALRNGVKWFTRAMGYQPANPDDLEAVRSAAVMGLIVAIHERDPKKCDRLAGLAADKIIESVAEHAMSLCAMYVPQRTLTRFFSILRKANGNVYEAAALAPSFSMSKEAFFAVLSALRNVDSYEGLSEGGERDPEGGHGGEVAADSLFEIRSRFESEVEDRILAEAALDAVDDLEEDVCRLAYGFSDYDPVPDAEIGARLGLSRPKTQRVRAGALVKMRSALGVS